jgi:hypothetical protein
MNCGGICVKQLNDMTVVVVAWVCARALFLSRLQRACLQDEPACCLACTQQQYPAGRQ